MNKIVLFSAIALVFASCNMASDADYKNMASDMCDCFNGVQKDLSPKAQSIIIESAGDEEKLTAAFEEYATEDPTAAMDDAVVLQGLENGEAIDCINKLEKKYDKVYSLDSEEEVQAKVAKVLEGMKGCEFTLAIMKMGMAAK